MSDYCYLFCYMRMPFERRLIFVMMDPWAYSVALVIGPCTLTRTLHHGNLAPWFEVHCCKNMPDLNLLVMFFVMALILY